jgi:hypothetical protein
MWDYETAPQPVSSGSVLDSLKGIFDQAAQAAGQRVQREIAGDTWTGEKTDPRLGVNEYGTVYAAGRPSFLSSSIAGVPAPLVLVGVGILALALVLHGK